MPSELFIRVGQRKEFRLTIRQADDLQTHGQAARGKARGNAHGRHPGLGRDERIGREIQQGPFAGVKLGP